MTPRKLASLSVAGAGALVAANAALSRRAGALEPPLPGVQRTHRFRGMDVAYADAGEGRDLVLLHGIHAAASSVEWRRIAGEVAADHRIVAPDLPGFGRSDRPPIAYDDELYTDFVGSFAADRAPGGVCVAAGLAGAHAILAQRERAPFSSLVLVCPTATTAAVRRPRLRALLRTPVVGTALFNGLVSKPAIRSGYLARAYGDPSAVPAAELDYRWRSAHQPGARFAPASFLGGYLDPTVDLVAAAADLDVPVTLVWGRDADVSPLAYGRDLAEAADARLVVFDRAKFAPHAEHPAVFADLLSDELVRATG